MILPLEDSFSQRATALARGENFIFQFALAPNHAAPAIAKSAR
jgi:hypothetical protein